MKHFVHLKDNIVFAYHQSENEVDIDGDNIIEVQENGEAYLNKKYVNGSFIDAPEIKYAILDSNNTVVSIKTTIFSSEVENNIIINDENVQVLWTWDGEKFNAPETVKPIDVIYVHGQPITTSEFAPAVTEEELAIRAAFQPIVVSENPQPEETPQPE